MNLFIAFS